MNVSWNVNHRKQEKKQLSYLQEIAAKRKLRDTEFNVILYRQEI